MKKVYIALSMLSLLLMSACSKEEILESQSTDDIVLLSTEIESIDSNSRADIGIDGTGRFVDGDVISLLIGDHQTEQQMSGGKWTPALSWDEIGESATFSAFYPQVPNTSKFTHTVETDQSKGKNFEKSDLLYATPVTANKGEEVKLNFKHLMGCLTVVLRSNVFTEEQLANAKVKLRGFNKIDVWYNGTLGKLHDIDHPTDKNYMSDIILKNQGDGIYQAVMCEQTKVHDYSYSGWWLTFNINGKDYYIENPPRTLSDGTQFIGFESGKNITLTYRINDKDTEFANKTCWVEGVKDIPDYSSKEWLRIDATNPNNPLKQLPWQASYGWYDLHKKNPAGPEYDDQNSCWAATTSNMIHWWLDRNKENIERYCTLNDKSIDDIPHKYTDSHNSEVYDLFKKRFTDNGGFVRQGLNWYFLGKYVRESDAAELISPSASDGYFKDVFDVNSNMYEHIAILDQRTLNTALKGAFKKKQAIGFAVWMAGFGSGHAMTIWGAEFDKNGDACAIYYVDNNDGPWEQPLNGLIRARVGEYEGENTKGVDMRKIFMENSNGKRTIEIQNMTMLGMKTEEWNSYFSRHNN